MKKSWIAVPAMVGALSIGGVAFANDDTGKMTPAEAASSKAVEATSDFISSEEAKSIAVEAAGGGEIVEVEQEDNTYEVDVLGEYAEVEVEINANSGAVLNVELDEEDEDSDGGEYAGYGDIIPEEDAAAIATEYTGFTAQLDEVELKEDDGLQVYEVELVDGQFEYEFEIDAASGEIIDYEKSEA